MQQYGHKQRFYTYEGSLSFSEGKYLAYNSEEKCWQLYDIPEAEDSGSLLVTPVGGVETQYSSVTAAFKALEENGGTIKLESRQFPEERFGFEYSER